MDRSHFRRSSLAACVLAGALLQATVAYAQSDEDRAGARAAATAGANAMQQGNWAQAVDLFTRAESLVHAPPHLLYIARANAKLGKLVRAREIYLKIGRETLAPNAPKAFVDAQAAAAKENADLEARIPTIDVVVEGEGAKDATVTRDGVAMSSALIGLPHPVDPGEHKYQAATKTMASDVVTVSVAEGAKETIKLTLKPPVVAVAAAVAIPAAVASPGPAATTAETKHDPRSWMKAGAVVGLGVFGAGAVLGTIFVLNNHSKISSANSAYTSCGGSSCAVANKPFIDGLDASAHHDATAAVASYVVSGVGLVAAATFIYLHDRSKSAETAPATTGASSLRPWFDGGAHGGTAGLAGSF